MAEFTVQQGKHYRAEISLRFFERMVSNETIEPRLREAGFADVRGGKWSGMPCRGGLAGARYDRHDSVLCPFIGWPCACRLP